MKAGLGRLTRVVALLAIAPSLAAMFVESASAGSRICRQLEAELASSKTGDRSTAQGKRYDIALNKQRDELQKARARARDTRCGVSLFGHGSPNCGALNAKIERMERNLEALQRKRAQFSGNSANRSRTQIMAELDAYGCRDEAATVRRLPQGIETNRDSREQFLGGIEQRQTLEDLNQELDDYHVRRIPGPLDGNMEEALGLSQYPGLAREFRTLCVRTCDGYFFPMSSASSLNDLGRDQKNCESRCPGTEVQVYYHRVVGEGPADMISSALGAPYSELPTAYLYQHSGVPRPAGCSCNAPKNFEINTGNPRSQEPTSAKSIVQLPAPGPDTTSGQTTDASVPRNMGNEDRKVRVVGPVFLPDPEGAIDLRAPARKKAQ